jgi:uncharacterized protein
MQDPLPGAMDDSPLEFPCDYALKVMGRAGPEFRARMLAVLEAHVGPIAPAQVLERPSRAGTYVALTCTLRAGSRAQLDRIYRDLHATGLVLYAL